MVSSSGVVGGSVAVKLKRARPLMSSFRVMFPLHFIGGQLRCARACLMCSLHGGVCCCDTLGRAADDGIVMGLVFFSTHYFEMENQADSHKSGKGWGQVDLLEH